MCAMRRILTLRNKMNVSYMPGHHITREHAYILYAGFPQKRRSAQICIHSVCQIAILRDKTRLLYMPDCHIAHKSWFCLYACRIARLLETCRRICLFLHAEFPDCMQKKNMFDMPDYQVAHRHERLLFARLPYCTYTNHIFHVPDCNTACTNVYISHAKVPYSGKTYILYGGLSLKRRSN